MVTLIRIERKGSYFSVERSCKLTLSCYRFSSFIMNLAESQNRNWTLEHSLIRTWTRSIITKSVSYRKSRTLFTTGTWGRIIALPAPDTSTRPTRFTASAPGSPVSPATVDCKKGTNIDLPSAKLLKTLANPSSGRVFFSMDASIFPCSCFIRSRLKTIGTKREFMDRHFFSTLPLRKVCIANRNIGQFSLK